MEGNPLHMDLGEAQGSWISRTPARHQPWIGGGGGGGGNTDYPFQETPHATHPPDLSQFGAVDYRSHWTTDLNQGGPVQATAPSRGSSGGNAGRYGLDSHWTSVSCEDLLAYTAMDAASLYSQINGRLQPVGGNRGGGGGQLLLNGRVALSQMSQYQRVEGFPVRLNPNPLEYDLNALPENKDNDVFLPPMRTTGQVSAPVTPEKWIQMQQRLPEAVNHEHFSFLTQEKQIQPQQRLPEAVRHEHISFLTQEKQIQPQQRLPEAVRHEHISFLTQEKQIQQPQQRPLEASVEQEHIGLLMHLRGVTEPDPTQLSIQENQAAGKEDAEQINLNKTPQQKHPRRRKYMPKVVKEGKKPRSRKVNTEATPKTPKRKYVRRADKTTEAIASGSVLDEATAEEGPPRQGRPVKRSLNFDSETRGNPHVDGFSIGALSPVRLGQGVEVVLERSPRGFAFDLNSYMTRMIDDYIGSPSANTASVPQTDSRKQQGREKLKDIARQKNVKSDDVNGDIQRQPTTLAEAHFQLMQVNKRKRTEKIYIDLTNETTSNCGSTIINNNIECVWSANHTQSPNQEVQSRELSNQMNLLSTPNQMDGTKKRRSKAPTRSRNLSSLTFSLDCKQNPLENVIVGEPQACVEALKVVNAKLKTRRRTKKGGQTGGANFLALVPYTDPMEELIKKLASLDINAIENAMVPYVANGTMVPFQPVKKRRPRARVILDDETLRLHKHLMLKASGDGSETMDEEKARWWEKEREIFRRRTDSFIRRMHEIQGDRTFSPWKGSVVDSVVGVFLTQNVSDHLSSSAFMALAARFPLRRQDMTEVPNAEEVSTSAEPQQIGIVELDSPTNESLCQGSCSQECMVRQEGEITEVGDSVVCRISKEKGLQSSPENRRDMRVMVMESPSVTEAEDSRSLDGISSQNSVISSQNSSEYPIVIADRMGSSSESNSEVEDLLTGNSGFESSMTSFMDLLQMAGNGNFKDLYANGYRSYTEETSVTAAHQLNFPGGPQRNLSFDLNNIQCGSQSTSMSNSPLMRESANSKDTLNVSYNSYHLHSSMQPGKFDRENVGSFQEISRSLPSAASELTVHNNKGRICGLGAGNTSIATEPYVQQTPQTAPARNLHSLISTGKDAKNEVHPPSHSGLCCERTLAISENNTEPVCPGSQVSRTVNIHQKEREPNVHVEGTRKTEYTNLLEGLAQRKGNAPADHTSTLPNHSGKSLEGNSKIIQNHEHSERKESDSLSKDVAYSSRKIDTETPKRNVKGKKITDETEKMSFDWDSLRREACCGSLKKERNRNAMDSLDWEAVRTAPVEEISNTIRERGMNNMLAERIKAFLNRVVQDHGSIDLEWLREVPPDKVKEYLLSIRGLGLKSVECVRLLTLHHLAFPVDTNVGRICVRLGWVPLEPLPESLQLHLLEMYPILESIQKYLWPRLCTLDQRTLYELHYQLITFGKVFCTKSKPNCNACPLKMECKHFASAFASARLALPGPEDKSLVTSTVPFADGQSQKVAPNPVGVPQIEGIPHSLERSAIKTCEPIIEEPTTPEPPEPERIEEVSENDIEEAFWQEDPDEIPPIVQDYEALKQNIQSIIESSNMDIENSDLSKALVALTPAAASIPMPKLKNVNRLRTEHRVYELPDTHPLLKGMDHREPDDPCSYLLAIWTPGETAQSFQPPETCCNSKETGALCHNETCFSCKSIQEANSHTVRGTLLIPCRTAMRGSFPLNGTYFQVNEVFADHDSSQNPIIVPRKLIWNLPRRTVYFGTSVPSIFKGLRTEEIQHCFWRGFVCVRGFDQKTRAPRPLVARLHFPASKVTRGKRTQAREEE